MKNEIEFKFGDYAIIEQKRYGVPNEMFVHKVVGQLRSNTWVDVPVRVPATETLHGEMEDICLCICCGIDETEVRRYRVKDMRRHSPVSAVADEKRGAVITPQAVNELITSLESAGELSIKERKYLELAKAYVVMAAENVTARNAVQVFCDVVGANTDAICEEVGPEGVRAILAAMSATGNMPATDRIYAGIKADGVEEFLKGSQLPYQIATVLADYDNADDETLHHVIWSGQPPEPDGDVWHLEYVSRGNAIVREVLNRLREGAK